MLNETWIECPSQTADCPMAMRLAGEPYKAARRQAQLLAVSALLVAALLAPTAARAQFVCQSTDGTGQGANASGSTENTACGPNANASGNNTRNTAVGASSIATGSHASAFGANTQALGANSVAIGGNAAGGMGQAAFVDAASANSIAIGNGARALALGSNMIAIGAGAAADYNNAIAIGSGTIANAENASAFGQNAQAGGAFNNAGATALGSNAQAGLSAPGRINATAVGADAQSNAARATALGQGALANFGNATALGQSARTDADNATSLGQAAIVGTGATGGSIAIGWDAQVRNFAEDSIAIGGGARVQDGSRHSIAIGVGARAGSANAGTDMNATAVGHNANAFGPGSTALGQGASVTSTVGTAVGQLATANTGAVALGQGTIAQFLSTAVGQGATANDNRAVALGQGASANAADSVAIGQGSVASVANTVSFGTVGGERRLVNVAAGTLVANGTDAVNAGQLFATNTNVANLQNQLNSGSIGLVQQAAAGQPITVAASTDGTSVNFTGTAGARTLTGISAGALAAASSDAVTGAQLFTANQRVAAAFGTVLDGANQIVAPSYTIQGTSYGDVASAFTAVNNTLNTGNPYAAVNSTGPNATATGTNAMAFGSGASATNTNAMAFGNNAQATGVGSIAIGNNAVATGSVAVGNNALASNGGAAFGDNAVATGANSTAVGPGATATHANSAAFGNGATTRRANQHVYGTASNTHTMPGIASAASRAAQSGPTQVVTADSAGNLATAALSDLGFATTSDIAAINSRLDRVSGRADKALTGVAMAFAMAGVPTLLPHERIAATLNVGTYQGSQGFAINAAWRVAENVQVNGGIGYGPDQNIVGGRAGLRVGW